MRHVTILLAAASLAAVSAACDDANAPENQTFLEEVSPAAGTLDADPEGSIVVRFSQGMASGMDQYVDLHQGGVDGPAVPMSCGLSDDRSTLTCTPGQPLQPGTAYTIHVGAGMMDDGGRPVEVEDHGMGMGGQPVTGEMMGNMHSGQSTGLMGQGWKHPGDGHLGMAFGFETA